MEICRKSREFCFQLPEGKRCQSQDVNDIICILYVVTVQHHAKAPKTPSEPPCSRHTINFTNYLCYNKFVTMAPTNEHQTETTLLLAPPRVRKGEFRGQSIEKEEMEKTTHNDPVAKREDIQRLFGSTLILHNVIVSHSQTDLTASLRRIMEPHQNGHSITKSASFSKSIAGNTKSAVLFLEKVKHNFFEDARSLAEGTIPQSVILAFIIGTVCGIACWMYYKVLDFFLDLIWTKIPEKFILGHWGAQFYWLYIPIAVTIFVTLSGLTVIILGEPGDLPYTISRVHNFGYIPIAHVVPMVFASLFSILAGGSLGPEAPLVAICGAIGGFISRRVFRQKYVNVVRKHTLMGMAGALAAFFGAPLGGGLFALEVCSRFGVEYFEHLIESIFCGEICLVVFRTLSGMSIAPIWDISGVDGRLFEINPWMVFAGGFIGLLGAFVAYLFATVHWANMSMFAYMQLLDNSRAVYRAWLGGFFIILIGVLVPQTLFWGEDEIQVVATWSLANDLPHVWPTTGYSGFEMNSGLTSFVVGTAKLVAVSFTVAGGLRGGYIFPLMMAGACFGRTIHCLLPDVIPLQVCVLCMAAGINVAITRTSLASTLILSFLSGEPCAIPSILMASLCSLFATAYLPFIKSQITRSDIDHSLYHHESVIGTNDEKVDDDDENTDDEEQRPDSHS